MLGDVEYLLEKADNIMKQKKVYERKKIKPIKKRESKIVNGTIWQSTNGRMYIYVNNRPKLLHRHTTEQIIGRVLRRDEIVKFKDGNPLNCSPENLLLMSDIGIDLASLRCGNCGNPLLNLS